MNLDPLVTHRFPLERAVEALELCSDVNRGSIKVQVVDEGEYEVPENLWENGGNDASRRESKL